MWNSKKWMLSDTTENRNLISSIKANRKPVGNKSLERMTETVYSSNDGIVEVILSNELNRYPIHNALMAVLKVNPVSHTRVQYQWGGITIMLNHSDLQALLYAFAQCDPEFKYNISQIKNKPIETVKYFKEMNAERNASHK